MNGNDAKESTDEGYYYMARKRRRSSFVSSTSLTSSGIIRNSSACSNEKRRDKVESRVEWDEVKLQSEVQERSVARNGCDESGTECVAQNVACAAAARMALRRGRCLRRDGGCCSLCVGERTSVVTAAPSRQRCSDRASSGRRGAATRSWSHVGSENCCSRTR